MELFTNCFLGVPLTLKATLAFDQVREQICAILPAMTSADRWQPHLTMYYLGSQQKETLDEIMRRAVQYIEFLQGEHITIGSLGIFRENDPRVVFLQVQCSSRIEQFYRVLCEDLSCFRVEQTTRDFHPHITLGRLYSDESQALFYKSKEKLQQVASTVQIHMEVDRFCLFGIAQGKSPEILREEIL